jgi:hypothetical protein
MKGTTGASRSSYGVWAGIAVARLSGDPDARRLRKRGDFRTGSVLS